MFFEESRRDSGLTRYAVLCIKGVFVTSDHPYVAHAFDITRDLSEWIVQNYRTNIVDGEEVIPIKDIYKLIKDIAENETIEDRLKPILRQCLTEQAKEKAREYLNYIESTQESAPKEHIEIRNSR